MKRRACLVFNPAAGRGRAEDLDDIRRRLEEVFELEVLCTSPDEDADACTTNALKARPDVVIAAGGDGTVSAVASILAGTDIPLGIIPRGTASSVAAGLGIPSDVDGAIETLRHRVIEHIDTARCGAHTSVLLCSVGFHADAVTSTSRESKNKWGQLAYVATAMKLLRELTPFRARIESESEIIECNATAITIANIAPAKTLLAQGPSRVSPDDGILDVTIVTATSLGEAVATGVHLVRTAAELEPASRDNVGFFGCRRVTITTDPPQHVLVDGEAAGMTPMEVVCRPRSLRVIVPERIVPREQVEEKLKGLPGLRVEKL